LCFLDFAEGIAHRSTATADPAIPDFDNPGAKQIHAGHDRIRSMAAAFGVLSFQSKVEA